MPLSAAVKADLTLVLVTLLAGVGWIFSKEALAGIAPITFIFLRFTSGGLVLAAAGHKQLAAMSSQSWGRAIRSGLSFGVAMTFWILGLKYGQHLGVGAFLTSLGAVLVPVVGWFMGDKPARSAWVSVAIAAVGLACLSLDGNFVFGLGELSFLMAALLFSFTFVLTSRAAAMTPAVALSSIQLLMVGLVALPVLLLMETWQLPSAVDIWLWVGLSVVLATCGRFFLQVWAQGKTSPSSAAVIMVLEPVWTALLAAAWFGEQTTPMQLVGCVLIFVALLASRWRAVLAVARKLLP